ncbi:unnamed protein product [Medioppia subpectinata]|uniref:Uncharacterized protein n=1 Tax=Medioppia subpectinata TaxID=1979941 RepID=A0A7R9PWF3_9ACAR|nr:unnamed protein product [Medioppia subpectinata]CAG2103716.1 unnamed protein product [Medioppia subpectinata]
MNVSHSYNSSSNQQLGVIVLNSDGSISESSGELMNDKKTAQIISWIISSIQMNECANPSDGHFNTITSK